MRWDWIGGAVDFANGSGQYCDRRGAATGPIVPILTTPPCDEPAERVLAAARAADVEIVIPRPGESIEPASSPAVETSWRTVHAR